MLRAPAVGTARAQLVDPSIRARKTHPFLIVCGEPGDKCSERVTRHGTSRVDIRTSTHLERGTGRVFTDTPSANRLAVVLECACIRHKEFTMERRVFQIGLVGAGAVSAGAYTAGVIDFLVYALDAWYTGKQNSGTPPHDVELAVFSGASAGGMTAALAVGYLASDQPPIASETDAAVKKGQNKLFDAWVERIDITHLLGTQDLQDEQSGVSSLLDSSILSNIADEALDVTPRPKRRAYVADNFEVLLTVTNLRGVPYEIALAGSPSARHTMTMHADYVHFRLNDTGENGLTDRYAMAWRDLAVPRHAVKEKLKLSAIASGAFPLGLAARTLSHLLPGGGQPDYFSSRKWPKSTPFSEPHQCVTHGPINASWGSIQHEYQYDFACVDGGVMDNEPLELARQVITQSGKPNRREGRSADRALLLIDPFPSKTTFDPKYQAATPDLFAGLGSLLSALINQARFKPAELLLAADEDVYSRFMIAPQRGNSVHALACGSLGGFGGFLRREFRAHDYFLGRRNAQKFLSDHFALPEKNPLFADWSDDMKNAHCVRDGTGKPLLNEENQRFLPIVPLVDQAAIACAKPRWPGFAAADLEILMPLVSRRLTLVANRLVDQYFKANNLVFRLIVKIILYFKKRDVLRLVRAKLHDDLTATGLMRKQASAVDTRGS